MDFIVMVESNIASLSKFLLIMKQKISLILSTYIYYDVKMNKDKVYSRKILVNLNYTCYQKK